MTQFYKFKIDVFAEQSVVASIVSSELDLSKYDKKTLTFKATVAGIIIVQFNDYDTDWDTVFRENTLANELYVNTFKDMFPETCRIKWEPSAPGTIRFCRFRCGYHGR